MHEQRPLGIGWLVDEVRAMDASPIRGVAIFGPLGTISAVMAAENPMWPVRDTRRKVARALARAAASSLPPVVALVVGTDSVNVYPATTKGHLMGGMVTQWHPGEFRAATYRPILSIRLTVLLRSGERFALETKNFPVGPNRFNRRVTRMIVEMAERVDGVQASGSN
ncbi:MAG TPA: hypothetical protein VK662_02910 [Acidothermaceae bacterium]|nr:hypothetical protein [Acidothermaceae bacterium]